MWPGRRRKKEGRWGLQDFLESEGKLPKQPLEADTPAFHEQLPLSPPEDQSQEAHQANAGPGWRQRAPEGTGTRGEAYSLTPLLSIKAEKGDEWEGSKKTDFIQPK